MPSPVSLHNLPPYQTPLPLCTVLNPHHILLPLYLQEFAFTAALTAALEAPGDFSYYNPVLRASEAEGLACCTMLLMLAANRISHSSLALQQARGLLKVLQSLQSTITSMSVASSSKAAGATDPTVQRNTIERLRKEMLTQSDNLAATLAMRRNYTTPVSPGVFEIDPRFLLFEFCHGLLLRPSQVHLVTKLLSEMEAGRSVCHQVRSWYQLLLFSEYNT